MDDDALVDAAETALRALGPRKLWMTARALARRIRKNQQSVGGISQVKLFDLLTEHAARGRGNRAVRNSPFPSATTLEVLWGSVEKVGECNVEAPFLGPRLDEDGMLLQPPVQGPDDLDALEARDDESPFFLSYNFQDSAAAYEIADILEREGLPVWIAGTRIAEGEYINQRVRDAIADARGLLLYLSADSMRSLWVAKEQIVGQARALPRTIIVKGDDPELWALVQFHLDPASREPGAVEPHIPMRHNASSQVVDEFRASLREDLQQPDRVVYLHPSGGHADGRRLLDLADFPSADG